MDELFPIGAGALLGLAFALASKPAALPRWAWIAGQAGLVAAAGLIATVISGEYAANWGFVLVDIGEAGLAFWIAAALLRWGRAHRAALASRRPV